MGESWHEKPPRGILISSDGVMAVVLGSLPVASGQTYQCLVQACSQDSPAHKAKATWKGAQTVAREPDAARKKPHPCHPKANPRQQAVPSAYRPIGSSLDPGTELGGESPEPSGHGVLQSLAANQAEGVEADCCSEPQRHSCLMPAGPSGYPTRD